MKSIENQTKSKAILKEIALEKLRSTNGGQIISDDLKNIGIAGGFRGGSDGIFV